MPKTLESMTTSTASPRHLFQTDITKNKTAYFLLTDSVETFWMKQNPTDWEEVKIDDCECYRDGGTTNYFFNEKNNSIHIPTIFEREKDCSISINGQSQKLKKLILSKEQFEEIGIIGQINLNLNDIPETKTEAEKKHRKTEEALEKKFPRKRKDSFLEEILGFKSNTRKFYRLNASNLLTQPDNSEAGTSSESDAALANEVARLKM